jgi:hypothetical protein
MAVKKREFFRVYMRDGTRRLYLSLGLVVQTLGLEQLIRGLL